MTSTNPVILCRGVSQICTVPKKIASALKFERLIVIFHKLKKKNLAGFFKAILNFKHKIVSVAWVVFCLNPQVLSPEINFELSPL